MRFRTFSLGMRHQLWGLFGLLLLAGATVLVIDEMLQSYTRTSLEQMRDNSLQRLRALKAVSDGYGLDVVDTTFRVRNDLMTWEKGVATIDAAQDKIDRSWAALQTMPRSPEQQVLFEQVRGARDAFDRRAMHTLREILVRRDLEGARPLRRHRAVSGHRPGDHAHGSAVEPGDAQFRTHGARRNRTRPPREPVAHRPVAGRAVACGLVGAAHSCATSTRAWKSLTQLARDMRKHQPDDPLPAFRPRGELGDVMDAFVDMRRDVMRYEIRSHRPARRERRRAHRTRTSR